MIARLVANDELNFLATNRIPRRLATDFLGWFSKIEQPLVARASIALWRLFSDVDLRDAAPVRYKSMHDCFTRRLVPGARPADPDPDVTASPCDAIVGACGTIEGDDLLQIKGMPYRLSDLLGDAGEAAPYRSGTYVTLRLTAGMYHRFHAPDDLTVDQVTYISGDCWNVNAAALKRVERLYCKNERAAIRCRTAGDRPLMLVAVAAVLVASIKLPFLGDFRPRKGTLRKTGLAVHFAKGEEMGWFEHGSTILLLAPAGSGEVRVRTGERIRAGQALLSRR